MWWFFVRDFYQATSAPRSASHGTAGSAVAAVAYADHTAPHMPSGLAHYLHRLSSDGEHAFGLWNSSAGFTVFSANFERVTGLSSGGCAAHDWIGSIHHDQQYALNETLLRAEDGHDGQCLALARRHGDEESDWRWLLIDVKAPTTREPNVMVLMRDLTQEKALEEALKQTEDALAISNRGRSAFLSSMSHELRTPLNAIMGFSEMMKSGVFGELGNATYQQYAEHIHESGQLLLSKVNDLLDIGSLDAGGLELEETRVDVGGVVHELIEIHSHNAFARQITLKRDTAQAEVQADRAKLLCIGSHFLSNALRHSANGTNITLSVRVTPEDGLIFSVRDAGEGIPAAQLDTIRKALATDTTYFQIESGGIGLGLSLARELAAKHQGRVMIDSIRHRGTVVSLILPPERVRQGMPAKKRRSL